MKAKEVLEKLFNNEKQGSLSSWTNLVYMDFKVLSTLYDSDIIISVKTMLYDCQSQLWYYVTRPKKSEHYVNNKEFLNALRTTLQR